MAADVHGAFNGIFLLHETYEMDLKKFSRGLVEVPGSDGKREIAGEIALADKDLGCDFESGEAIKRIRQSICNSRNGLVISRMRLHSFFRNIKSMVLSTKIAVKSRQV